MKSISLLCASIILCILSALCVAEPVNINVASAEEISDAISGIGAKKAQEIVEYRNQHGPFSALEDLLQVKGIGDALLHKIAQDIVIE